MRHVTTTLWLCALMLAVPPAGGQEASRMANVSVPAPAAEGLAAKPRDAAGVPTFRIEDGRVDAGTWNGYRRYAATCMACHGQDGVGGSFAPALAESLRRIDYAGFMEVVRRGRTGTSSQASVMPAFGNNPNVLDHADDIYRYLSARANGGLDRGRPQRLPD